MKEKIADIQADIKRTVKNALTNTDIKDLKCIHRHTMETHPRCFARGDIKWPNDKSFERATGEPWYNWDGYRIGYIDIETDALNANHGTMLSWAIKEKDGDTQYDVISKADLFDPKIRDRRIVESLIKAIDRYSILVTYYGTKFDIPFIRTKAMKFKIPTLHYGSIYHHDLYYTVRAKMCLSRNSLGVATEYLGIPGKTPIPHSVWYDAKYGEPYALDYVLEHNVADVDITEALHNELEPFRKWLRKSV